MSASIGANAARRFKPSFFFWMILAMCVFVFGGFGMNSFIPALRGDFPPAPPIVHVHGVIFIAWMLLLVAQSALIGAGNVKLHRSLGTWGIAHATAVLFTGALIQLIGSRKGMDGGGVAASDGLYLGFAAVIGFAIMFTLAIRNTKRPEIHRRMMLFAMLPLLPPGVNRFWFIVLGLDDFFPTFWLYLTLWSMAAAILLQEWRSTGKLSRYSLFGAGWIFVQGIVHEPILLWAPFQDFSVFVLGLVHYR